MTNPDQYDEKRMKSKEHYFYEHTRRKIDGREFIAFDRGFIDGWLACQESIEQEDLVEDVDADTI